MLALDTPCTAFEGSRRIASGAFADVALAAKHAVDAAAGQAQPLPVLVFIDASSEVVELDWRGSAAAFTARLQATAPAPMAPPAATPDDAAQALDATRGPGRPKLGVVAREVTLLPRHWDWLAGQRGGASVALRKLVDEARRSGEAQDRVRRAAEVGYKFMSTMAGHLPGFEEASRALFAGDAIRFAAHTATWPTDLQQHLTKTLAPVFGD